MGSDGIDPAVDPLHFRQVLGHYPTGVTVVTALGADRQPLAMVIGSFTSVSMDPPLVAFLPAKNSRTFASMDVAKGFCVNVLAATHEELVRTVTSKKQSPFDMVEWRRSANGIPVLDDAIAWIECRTHQIVEAGDHHIVIGRILSLSTGAAGLPLVFFRGGYGRFAPVSLVAAPQADITSQIRLAHIARPEMERLAASLGLEVTCNAMVNDCLVILASAGNSDGATSWVGLRSPALPPISTIYVAWSSEQTIAAWLAQVSDEQLAKSLAQALARVRQRGWAVSIAGPGTRELDAIYNDAAGSGLTDSSTERLREVLPRTIPDFNPDLAPDALYPVRVLAAPVFNSDGEVCLTLQLRHDGRPVGTEDLQRRAAILRAAANRVTSRIGGKLMT